MHTPAHAEQSELALSTPSAVTAPGGAQQCEDQRAVPRHRRLSAVLTALALVLGGVSATLIATPPAQAATEAIRDYGICTQNTLPRSDDGSSPALTLPFSISFFGTVHDTIYVNNNGNVTFNGARSTFTPSALTGATGIPMIAAYFADVDTRNSAASAVTYGWNESQFCVNWVGVGYFSQQVDKTISAQLVITDRSAEAGFDGAAAIELNYSDIQWETGSASGGSNGFGGTSAAVGFTAGTGETGTYSQFPGSLVPGSLIDGGSNALVESSRNSSVLGRYVFDISTPDVVLEGTLTGQISDHEGTPVVANVEVCPEDGTACLSTSSSSTGQYSIIGLGVGDYVVTATPPTDSGFVPVAQPVTITGGETSTLNFQFAPESVDPTGSVEASVITADGDGVEGATVAICNAETDECVADLPLTDGAGALPLIDVAPGDYVISVTAPDGAELSNGSAEATVMADETNEVTITLLPLLNRVITGTVVDQHGNPVQAVATLLEVSGSDSTPVAEDSVRLGAGANPQDTSADGAFEWSVAAGSYAVSVTTEDCGVASQDVVFDDTNSSELVLTVTCPPVDDDDGDDDGEQPGGDEGDGDEHANGDDELAITGVNGYSLGLLIGGALLGAGLLLVVMGRRDGTHSLR